MPSGILFYFVTCPNYLFESLAWVGFNVATWTVWGALPLLPRLSTRRRVVHGGGHNPDDDLGEAEAHEVEEALWQRLQGPQRHVPVLVLGNPPQRSSPCNFTANFKITAGQHAPMIIGRALQPAPPPASLLVAKPSDPALHPVRPSPVSKVSFVMHGTAIRQQPPASPPASPPSPHPALVRPSSAPLQRAENSPFRRIERNRRVFFQAIRNDPKGADLDYFCVVPLNTTLPDPPTFHPPLSRPRTPNRLRISLSPPRPRPPSR
jgi:hypothetical protein